MVHKIPQPSVTSTPTRLIGHITEIRLSLFAFLSLADAVRLLTTCHKLREDTANVELLLKQSPVIAVVFHSHTISRHGCLPLSPTCPLHEASSASALSVAALWEKELLPMCYQWHHGRRISMRVESFVLPLLGVVESVSDIYSALEGVLTGLGRAFLDANEALRMPSLIPRRRRLARMQTPSKRTTSSHPCSQWTNAIVTMTLRLSLI
jgi:hypothetical protein